MSKTKSTKKIRLKMKSTPYFEGVIEKVLPVIKCGYDELLDISKFKPHPKNPNKHSDDQIERLAKLIDYQGMRRPIIVSKLSGYIVAGHGTLAACKKNTYTHAPVSFQEFKDEDQEYAFIVSDNAIAEWAELDLGMVNLDLQDLNGQDFDIEMLGLQNFEITPEDKKGDIGDDEIPEIGTGPTKCKTGDLWILGEHRLLVGDCTVKENVERLMDGQKADMVFTDPPYGVSYQQGKFKQIENDTLRGEDLKNFLTSAWKLIPRNDPCVIYSWSPPLLEGAEVLKSLIESGWHIQSMLIWDKQRLILGRADYQWQHELCWYGYIGTNHYWCGDRTQTTIIKQKRDSKYDHPTQKPIELAEKFINNSSVKNHIIYDCFSGSGSTLIACEKTNRKCFGMEIDHYYCDVIISRWQKFSGKKAVREDGVFFSDVKPNKTVRKTS